MPLLGLTKGALFSITWVLEDEVIYSPRGMEGCWGAAWTKTMAARTVNAAVIFISVAVCCLLCSGFLDEFLMEKGTNRRSALSFIGVE